MSLKNGILIVDDEKNIRMTLTQALKSFKVPVDTAMNGEEALVKMKADHFDIVLLDLKMPGMDGMEVLEKIRESWPSVRVMIITAHGTMESAVDAMKLGAVDFVQKPFSVKEIRKMVSQVVEREDLNDSALKSYDTAVELVRKRISEGNYTAAEEAVKTAISLNPDSPEAYNLRGAILEIQNKREESVKFYRAALDIDPSYKPAKANLKRATSWAEVGDIDL